MNNQCDCCPTKTEQLIFGDDSYGNQWKICPICAFLYKLRFQKKEDGTVRFIDAYRGYYYAKWRPFKHDNKVEKE